MQGAFNIPNAVSVVRLLLIPLFVWLALNDQTAWAGALLGVIGATDWIDGYLARKLDQVTEVGKMLDPIADRLAVVVAVIVGLIVGVLPLWFGWGIIIREVVIGIGALYGWLNGVRRLDVRWLGKLATLLLYFGVTTFYIAHGLDLTWLWWCAMAVSIPGLVTYYVVAFAYLGDMRGAIAAARSAESTR
ncbi:MAG TPA: CDP-alcohol phosphatidyltransferase family protein [Acidimicrobiia bacterium]|nr:CDP-alcohol phosphatidyltransferase family protein [Acidimicrobiia bacterium]